ncbi:MAG TPA: hypothetical protein VNY31_01360 [Solirubrobacteraceae bacterium]|jgi:hypothetical protein|nr:hypothetical protein [Solirubrobacteraceae bacterium]
MAATELSPALRQSARRWLPAGLPATWLHAYAAIWIATLAPAAIVALVGQPLARPAHRLLALGLTAQRNPPPHVGHVLALAAHNIPIASWPLLLGVLGAHRHRLATHVSDGVLLACIVVNTLPVGAALGAYGGAVLPYLPHLPLEWGGLALGASAWLAQRRQALTVSEGIGLFLLIACVLLCAAVLESVGVPHR